MICATVLADSIAKDCDRLTTFSVKFHQVVLVERNRHRGISISDSSTRAVPPARYIAEVRSDPAMPIEFRKHRPGMGGGDLMAGAELREAQLRWQADADLACDFAQAALDSGESKETVNARLLPYIYTTSIMTATEPCWLNFFGLRLSLDARPEIRVLAEHMWEAWQASQPKKLYRGEWHLPLVSDLDGWCGTSCPTCNGTGALGDDARCNTCGGTGEPWSLEQMKKVSAARCARQSFNSAKTFSIAEDLALFDRLKDLRHWSPLEHQATPDEKLYFEWRRPYLHGNLPGWCQYRKFFPGEAVAPLPEGYIYNRP